ncbi:HAD family hydrolase [Vulcanisaeta distributa]|uniref:HAD-superfamily hydrolase, subfamily IA, variant 1 n=1 Tax=Vulcanisaeta distributa (strain DSM 14429 / JCM 11212 / NBRC 100878 / IC-017) TaxID=572478 RepID=E1QTL7_VULDI|nr:HAD-IA family hydrolase [Vulcanisaeta distributa]ADN49732.1 HAD-superfamily hydrolase, subfamily IA, variant 1 [Vulcanisaeta distributa DSM 14429]
MVHDKVIDVRAVLFDYDDTLVETRGAMDYARRAVARKISLRTSLDEYLVLNVIRDVEVRMESIGQFDRRVWFSEVVKALNIDLSIGDINDLVKTYWDSLRLRSRLFPDVIPTLGLLRACGFRIGLVTNTDGEPGLKRDRIRGDGVDGLFDLIIVAGDDTVHTKPHPEPFIKALQTLNMRGYEVVYIGDRVDVDVAGAKAVGMHAGLIDRYGTADPRAYGRDGARPDFIIYSLAELPQLLSCVSNA